MLPLGKALAQCGFRVKGILLPGHGTNAEDMELRRWPEWLAAVQAGFDQLVSECGRVSVAGLSMGGTLALFGANAPSLSRERSSARRYEL